MGLALGGGGARGLAHVAILEALDRLGLRPKRIAGTSLGAVVGCLYASGLSARQIRRDLREQAAAERLRDIFPRRSGPRLLDLVRLERARGGVLSGEHFLERLVEKVHVRSFAELDIPLQVVAADFWTREEVILESGELMPALQASMALPAIFRPVQLGGRVLVDGGAVNPVPFDLLQDDCDIVVAVNVVGRRSRRQGGIPSYTQAVFNTFQIMQMSIVREKLARRPPTIYLEPDLVDIRMLEFYRVDDILAQAEPTTNRLVAQLTHVLEAREAASG